MTVDFSATPENNPMTNESPMFAAVPSWERGTKKRRGFGARPAAKTATALPSDEVIATRPITTRPDTIRPDTADLRRAERKTVVTGPVLEPANEALMSRPIAPVRKSSSAIPMAIAAGVVAVGALGAAGWYAAKPHNAGVAQLTPGQAASSTTVVQSDTPTAPTTSEVAANSLAPPAVVTPAPTATRTATTTTSAPVRHAAKAAPVSRSVDDAGVNASATVPAAPQPYSVSAVNPMVPPAPAPAAVAPPAAVEAVPAPAEAAPAAPPTQAAPDTVTTAPPEPAVGTPPAAAPSASVTPPPTV